MTVEHILKQISDSDLMAAGGTLHGVKLRLAAADKLGAALLAQEVLLLVDAERIRRGMTGDAEHEAFFREALAE